MTPESSRGLALTPSEDTAMPVTVRFPLGAYRANLYVYDPFGRIDWYALPPESFEGGKSFTFGRGTDCDIALNDGAVSTRHACIRVEPVGADPGRLVLRDLGSTNGTLVNGDRVEVRGLQHGDVLRLGATDVRFLFSYRMSPVRLSLEFCGGPHTGSTLAAEGASTSIGQQNCAVNLAGEGVAAQHVRVDAYGSELLFVANLQRANATWLNGQRVVGIVPARSGDRLRVGEHEVVLRVRPAPGVDAAHRTPVPAVPSSGSGQTLALASDLFGTDLGRNAQPAPIGARGPATGGTSPGLDLGTDPGALADPTVGDRRNDSAGIVQIDRAVFEAELAARPTPAQPTPLPRRSPRPPAAHSPLTGLGVPQTPSPGLFLTPTQPPEPVPPEGLGPTRELIREPRAPRSLPEVDLEPEARWRERQRPPAPRPRRRWTTALFLSAAVGLVLGAAALWALPQPQVLAGRLAAGLGKPLLAPVTGRVEQVHVRAGDVVAPGAVVARFTDAEVAAEIEALTAQITALEPTLQPTREVQRLEVPAALRRRLNEAQSAFDAAREARRAMLDAFNRREVGLERLEETRAAETAAQARLAAVRAEVAGVDREAVVETGPSTDAVALLDELKARRARLDGRRHQTVHAAEGGQVVWADGGEGLVVGASVPAGATLLSVVSLDPLEARFDLDEPALRALEAAGEARIVFAAEVTSDAAAPAAPTPPQALVLKPSAPVPLGDGRFRVTVTVPNPAGTLRPGQPISAHFEGEPRSALRIGLDRLFGPKAAPAEARSP